MTTFPVINTFVKFDVPYTFRVEAPYTTAELTVRYPTFRVVMFARGTDKFPVRIVFEETLRN